MYNLLPNSEMSICTALQAVRVGSPISISAFSDAATGVGNFVAASSTTSHAGGLTPGKLCLIEGATSPHSPISLLSATVTLNKRITATASSFTGVIVGNLVQLTGGTTTSPLSFYYVTATDSSTYIELCGFSAAQLINETKTFSMTFYQGVASSFNSNVNGIPTTGDPSNRSIPGYPLLVTACNSGSFNATLGGYVSSVGTTASAIAWEMTVGDDGYGTGDACDGWVKSTSLKYWRMFQYDWDGITSVVMPGSAYATKLVKGAASTEQLTCKITQNSTIIIADGVANPSPAVSAKYKGKSLCFGMYVWAQAGATVQLFIQQDSGFDYSNTTTTSSGYIWLEVTSNINNTNKNVTFGLNITGNIGVTALVTQPIAIFGNSISAGNYVNTKGYHAFTTHPNFPRNWFNGTVPNAAYIRIQQESIGALPGGLSAIHCGIEGYNSIPSDLAGASAVLSTGPNEAVATPTIYQQQIRGTLNFSSGLTTAGAGTTNYAGVGVLSANETVVCMPVPFACVVKSLYASSASAPSAGQTFIYTLRKTLVDTALTCTSSGASQAGNSDTSHSVTFSAGDVADIKIVTSGGAAVVQHNIACEFNRSPSSGVPSTSIWGNAPVGLLIEADGSNWPSDVLYWIPTNTGWAGVNIDMSGCQIN